MLKHRSTQQNKALHLMFELCATELNLAGMDIRKTIKADIPWSKELVKELLWRPLQQAQFGKQSTTEMTSKEIDRTFEVLNKALGDLGITVIFPSIESVILEQEAKEYE